jgi:ribonuclease III
MPPEVDDLAEIEARLGLKFRDKSLLQRAFTHRSYLNEYPGYPVMDNERLEFLGDAVIDFVTAEFLYNDYPDMDEGHLTRLRAALVRTESLAVQAQALDLGQYLRLGRGEIASGGRNRPNNLCGVFEALIGAIYLDQGIDIVKSLLVERFDPAAVQVLQAQSDRDAKSVLQEIIQAETQITPTYHLVGQVGPDHDKEFSVEVRFDGQVIGRGRGHSKQTAEQSAAQDALGNSELLLNLRASARK